MLTYGYKTIRPEAMLRVLDAAPPMLEVSHYGDVFDKLFSERQLCVLWSERRWLRGQRTWGVLAPGQFVMSDKPMEFSVPLYVSTRVALEALKVQIRVRGL